MSPRRNTWGPPDGRYGTYDTSEGYGNPDAWRDAFRARFTDAQIAAMLDDDDPWAVLGLTPGSSLDQVKAAYRRKARETHPDLHPGIDRALFQKVGAAYETLITALG